LQQPAGRFLIKPTFEVSILALHEVHTLPGIWPPDELRELLVRAEFDDAGEIAESDLLEMAIMALQDLGNQQAGELVLDVIFGDAMRPGVRQNLVDDLQEDSPWDDFANVAQQRGLFVAVVLLHRAFPNRYGTPDALELTIGMRSLNESGSELMKTATPAWLVRLLSCGLSETDVLHRLYEDDLKSGPFTVAAGLIWNLAMSTPDSDEQPQAITREFKLITSPLWFGPLRKGQSFNASF